MFDPFDPEEETRADLALRAGLRDLPTPSISADFDGRIQEALAARPTWRQTFRASVWLALRPAATPAVCTLFGTLLLLRLVQKSPIRPQMPIAMASAQTAPRHLADRRVYDGPEENMEDMNLTRASLGFFRRSARRNADKNG